MAKLKELSNYYLIFEIIHFLPAIFEWYITHIVELPTFMKEERVRSSYHLFVDGIFVKDFNDKSWIR